MPEIDVQKLHAAQEIVARGLSDLLPEIILSVAICVLFLLDLVLKRPGPARSAWIAVAAIGLAGFAIVSRWPDEGHQIFGWMSGDQQSGLMTVDAFGGIFRLLALAGTLAVIPLCRSFVPFEARRMGEFYALLLGAALGMLLMAGASNLLMIYLGIEFASMSSYLLTAYLKRDPRSSEAGLKYVIYGSVASGAMIFGLSLLYGMTGSLDLGAVSEFFAATRISQLGLSVTAVLIFGGFAYKMAAFPMHFWAPDAYEGAPLPVTAFLATASKAAGFAVFIRFLMAFAPGFGVRFEGFAGSEDTMAFGWKAVIGGAAALSMFAGNLAALWQTNVKRMLAYSSIAHAGYLLMGVAALHPGSTGGAQFTPIVFYFIVYFFMNLGIFYVLGMVGSRIGGETVDDFRGLGRRAPVISLCLVVFLIALVGLPPTGGFSGKLQLFKAVIEDGQIWLAIVAAVNTAISLYYYARILKATYFEASDVVSPIAWPRGLAALTVCFAVIVIVLGIWFGPVIGFAGSFPLLPA